MPERKYEKERGDCFTTFAMTERAVLEAERFFGKNNRDLRHSQERSDAAIS